jgi:hypothetical protein
LIYLYNGTPGSGKSYHSTLLVHKATKRKVNVIANFSINLPTEEQQNRMFYCPTVDMSPKAFLDFHLKYHDLDERGAPKRESQTIIMIDEASILFNSREFGRKDRADWIVFFSQHRKFAFDVILITQIDRTIDRQIRGNVEIQKLHRKLSNYGFKGLVIRLLTGKNFVCISKWYQIKNMKESRVGVEYFGIKPKIANSYDTYSMFSLADEADRLKLPEEEFIQPIVNTGVKK